MPIKRNGNKKSTKRTGASARKTASRANRSKAAARIQRDEQGPLGWLKPDWDSAASPLIARGAARTGPHTTPVPSTTNWRDVLVEYRKRKHSPARARLAAPAPVVPGGQNWLSLGPTVVLNGQTVGNQPVGGRVSGIAVGPGGQIVYAASANGGVFRSDDGATSWRALMDGLDDDPTNFASASVICGAIALDPADTNRVYVGTGEGDTDYMFRMGWRVVNALPAYRGIGPVRTDDGGSKWILETSNPDLSGESFFALALDPTNRENVVGATSNGLYHRVASSGAKFTWNQVRPGVHSSVAVTQSGTAVHFYAAEWGKQVLQSNDGGKTWATAGSGFPAANVGRIEVAAAGNVIYAFVASTKGGVLGLYRLDGTGAWKKISGVPNVLYGSQGDYDLSISISPGDPNTVYIGGDRTNAYPYSGNIQRLAIQASGANYKVKTATQIGTSAHADVHTLVHSPGDHDELWCGCDGGVFLNRNPRGSGQFASQNSGLSCLCTNFFAQHPTDPSILIAGLQDNGTARTVSGPMWTHVQDGDGGYCIVNWANPSRVLVYMNGYVFASTDGGATFAQNPVLNQQGATMTVPVVSPPYDPANPANANIVALGEGSNVFISPDFGTTWPANQKLSLPGTPGDVFALTFASAARLFIGTTTGAVFRADRSGSTWKVVQIDNVAVGPLGLQGLITDIAVDWGDASRSSVFVSFGGQSSDRHRVWRFDGTKWAARSGPDVGPNLLNVEHNAIVVDPAAPANVYAAADIGVWHSADSGMTWATMENGLPESPVYDILIHPTQRLLRAATHGRGVYEIALP